MQADAEKAFAEMMAGTLGVLSQLNANVVYRDCNAEMRLKMLAQEAERKAKRREEEEEEERLLWEAARELRKVEEERRRKEVA